MSEDTAPPALTLDAEQTASLQEQCAKFEPNEPYFVALTQTGVCTCAPSKGFPKRSFGCGKSTQPWRSRTSAGYRPEIRHISIKEL